MQVFKYFKPHIKTKNFMKPKTVLKIYQPFQNNTITIHTIEIILTTKSQMLRLFFKFQCQAITKIPEQIQSNILDCKHKILINTGLHMLFFIKIKYIIYHDKLTRNKLILTNTTLPLLLSKISLCNERKIYCNKLILPILS